MFTSRQCSSQSFAVTWKPVAAAIVFTVFQSGDVSPRQSREIVLACSPTDLPKAAREIWVN